MYNVHCTITISYGTKLSENILSIYNRKYIIGRPCPANRRHKYMVYYLQYYFREQYISRKKNLIEDVRLREIGLHPFSSVMPDLKCRPGWSDIAALM